MRKIKQVEEKRVTFEMQEWAEVKLRAATEDSDKAGKQALNLHLDFKLRKCYNDGDIFAVGNGGIMKQTVRTAMTRKAAVR